MRRSVTTPHALLVSAGLAMIAFAAQASAGVSRDADGWTVVTPAADTKIYYVSQDGSDSYTGLSPNYTGGSSGPFRTIDAAMARIGRRSPDWVLLRKGDTFEGFISQDDKDGGRSATEPFLLSSYEDPTHPSTARPIVEYDGSGYGAIFNNEGGNFYVIGIAFYDPRKDPASPKYVTDGVRCTASNAPGFAWTTHGENLLVEDCVFSFFANGISVDAIDGTLHDVSIRRNVIHHNYSAYDSGEYPHAQGLFGNMVDNLLIEDNVFDHNAWNDEAGIPADVFNHHIYVCNTRGLTIRQNLLLRCESLSVKICDYGRSELALTRGPTRDVLLEDNLFFGGEVGVSITHGDGAPPEWQATNVVIRNNVLSQINRDNPTGRGLGWGMDIAAMENGLVSGNLFSDFHFTPNTYALYLVGDVEWIRNTNITVRDNLIYRVPERALMIEPIDAWSNVLVTNNTIQDPDAGSAMVENVGALDPFRVTYSNNTYSGSTFRANGANLTFAQWQAQSGDTGSQVGTVGYPEPGRTLDSYVALLGMTLDQFYAACRAASQDDWHPEYLATAINDYLRAGFGLAVSPSLSVTGADVTEGDLGSRNATFTVTLGGAP